jgi:hypothetical protein
MKVLYSLERDGEGFTATAKNLRAAGRGPTREAALAELFEAASVALAPQGVALPNDADGPDVVPELVEEPARKPDLGPDGPGS